MPAGEAHNGLPEALNHVRHSGDRVLITRRGEVVGALISACELELLEDLEDRY